MKIRHNRSVALVTVVLLLLGLRLPLLSQTPAMGAAQWVTPAVDVQRVQHRTFDSKAAAAKVSYHIYTPAIYEKEPSRRFPVMYWLHGTTAGVPGVPAGLVTNVNARIDAGTLPPFLIVFPNGLGFSMWTDSKDGRLPMETIVIKELLPHIDATFRTVASRDGRAIEGASMGGHGAARLGFKYPGLFGSVSILFGGPLQQVFDINTAPRAPAFAAQQLLDAVWGGDQDYYRAQSGWALAEANADAVRRMRAIRMIVGDQDPILDANRRFDAHLTRLQIPHTFTVLPGVGHGPVSALAKALGEEFFAFYKTAFAP